MYSLVTDIYNSDKDYILKTCKSFDRLLIDEDGEISHNFHCIGKLSQQMNNIINKLLNSDVIFDAYLGYVAGKWNPDKFKPILIITIEPEESQDEIYRNMCYFIGKEIIDILLKYLRATNSAEIGNYDSIPNIMPKSRYDYSNMPSKIYCLKQSERNFTPKQIEDMKPFYLHYIDIGDMILFIVSVGMENIFLKNIHINNNDYNFNVM